MNTTNDQIASAVKQASILLNQKDVISALNVLKAVRGINEFANSKEAFDMLHRIGHFCRRKAIASIIPRLKLEGHTNSVTSVAIKPDGRAVSSASKDGTLRIWDVHSGECLKSISGGTINAMAITPDGNFAMCGGDYSGLTLWNVQTGSCIKRFENKEWKGQWPVKSVAVSVDGRLALSAVASSVMLWDIQTGQCLKHLWVENTCVSSVTFRSDSHFALAGSDGLRLWDIHTGKCIQTFRKKLNFGFGEVFTTAFGINGSWGLAGTCGELKIWDLKTGEIVKNLRHGGDVLSVAISADGRWAASGCRNNEVYVWDLHSGECIKTLKEHLNNVTSVALSTDNRWLVSGSDDKTLRVWELEWDYEFPGWADWDDEAMLFLHEFLLQHRPIGPDGLTRDGQPVWAEEDFNQLLLKLQYCGYGWLRSEGVKSRLTAMAQAWPLIQATL